MIKKLVVLAWLTSSLALAQNVPGSITFNARLVDTGGAPVTGSHALGFGLYDQASGGAAVWTENLSGASFSTDGLTYAELGAVTPLTASALDGRKLYLEVSVDGTTMSPRLAIVSVPYAIRASVAATAMSVGSLTESAIQRRVTGDCGTGHAMRSIDASGGVQCENLSAGTITAVNLAAGSGLTGGGTIGDLSLGLATCGSGQVLRAGATAGQWACSDDTYAAAANGGLTLTGRAFSADPSVLQKRVSGACASGAISAVNADGSVSCQAAYTAGPGVSLSGSTVALAACANGEVLRSTGSGYACASAAAPQGRNLIDWASDVSRWVTLAGSTPTVSLNTTDVREGDSSFEFVQPSSGTGSTLEYGTLIPVNPEHTYEGRISARLIAGSGTFSAGFAAYDAARLPLANNPMMLASAATLPATWTVYRASATGEGATAAQFPPGTRFVRPRIVVNAANVGTTRVDGFELYQTDLGTLVAGSVNVAGGMNTQGFQVQRDIATWNTTANVATPIHVKTNIPVSSNVMFRVIVEGYNYGVALPIFSDCVAYPYAATGTLTSSACTNYAGGTALSLYQTADNFVAVKLTQASTYYLGFSLSAMTLNPAGAGFQVQVRQIAQQAVNF